MPNDRQRDFIRALAEYLGGTNQAAMSIRLEMNDPQALLWRDIRSATPLIGYPSVEETEEQLIQFLWKG